jgi:hypothetical protein
MNIDDLLKSKLIERSPNLNLTFKVYLEDTNLEFEKCYFFKPQNLEFFKSINISNHLNWTSNIKECDFIFIPYAWSTFKNDKSYIQHLENLSQIKTLVIFNLGDESPDIPIINCIQIKNFLHPWQDKSGKIIIPYNVIPRKFVPRSWSAVPTISFIGFLPKIGTTSIFSYSWRSIFYPFRSNLFIHRNLGVRRIKNFGETIEKRISLNQNYTAYSKNLESEKLIHKYNESLATSDYVFCPRGFGNSSMRLYEVISAGRIPILTETYSGFPLLGGLQKFEDLILTLNWCSNWENEILNHWNSLKDNNRYYDFQKTNADVFSNFLDIEKYLIQLFKLYLK